jgi:sugar O-acyltransferase (sialic acid O-acetyltransferase NeuD family)
MNILILGAGSFAREVYDWCIQANHSVVGFYATTSVGSTLRNLPIYNKIEELRDLSSTTKWIIGVGEPSIIKILTESIGDIILPSPAVIHPSCIIGSNVRIGLGTVICPNSILTCDIEIGEACVINIGCTIGHDCIVGRRTHLSPNSSLSGYTKVGEECSIGTGVSTIPSVCIASRSIVGAGSVITKSLSSGLHVGVPATTKRFFGGD